MNISTKLMTSYVILLVTAFIIANVITSTIISRRLLVEGREDLIQQSQAITEVISEAQFDFSQPRKLLTYFKNSKVTGVIDSEMYIFSVANKLIYASNEEVSLTQAREFLKGDHPEYIKVSKELVNNGEVVGRLLLLSEVRHIDAIVLTIKRTLFLGMIVALFLALLMAYFMQRSIVKPIKMLKDDIHRSMVDPSHIVKTTKNQDEIGELFKAYHEMTLSINNNMEERKRFFQNASHELKTPLMSIQGYAEAIKDGVISGAEVEEGLDIIIMKSQQLKKTVEEIIYLSKLMNKDYEYILQPCNLMDLVHSVVEGQNYLAFEKGVLVKIESQRDDLMADVDIQKFESVLDNLLSNAIRYAKSIIKIELLDMEEFIVIRISDDGIGLKPSEIDRVFERFYKGEDGKSGIGLALVHEIIKGHNGQIRAGNHISGGAVFEIKLIKGI